MEDNRSGKPAEVNTVRESDCDKKAIAEREEGNVQSGNKEIIQLGKHSKHTNGTQQANPNGKEAPMQRITVVP